MRLIHFSRYFKFFFFFIRTTTSHKLEMVKNSNEFQSKHTPRYFTAVLTLNTMTEYAGNLSLEKNIRSQLSGEKNQAMEVMNLTSFISSERKACRS